MSHTNSFEESQEFRSALMQSAQLLGQNQPEEAERLLLPLYSKAPKHIDVAINLGGAYILQRKWNKAVRVLQAVTKSHPDHAMLWMNLGAAQLGRLELSGPKQQADAIESFGRALEIDPFTPNAHYQIGLIYKDQGNWERAIHFFEEALKVHPTDQDARYWLKKINERLTELQQEIEESLEENNEQVMNQDVPSSNGHTIDEGRESD